MACSDGLDLALGAGVAGFGFSCRCGQYVHWQWAVGGLGIGSEVVFGLGSGIMIQIYGDCLRVRLNDRFLGLFPCFMSTTLLSY